MFFARHASESLVKSTLDLRAISDCETHKSTLPVATRSPSTLFTATVIIHNPPDQSSFIHCCIMYINSE